MKNNARKMMRVVVGTACAGMALVLAVIMAELDAHALWVYGFGAVALLCFGIAMSEKDKQLRVKQQPENKHVAKESIKG